MYHGSIHNVSSPKVIFSTLAGAFQKNKPVRAGFSEKW